MKNNIQIQEFSAAYVPQYQEVIKNKPYVFYGEDNCFPNHLLALYQYSAIHRACANAVIYGVTGKNLKVIEGDPNAIAMANRNDSVFDVYQKLVTDRVLFGGMAMNIVKSNDGGIAEFYHTDFSRLRAGKEDQFGNIGHYYYSIDWRGTTTNPNKWKPLEIESFNMLPDSDPSQIMYFKRYNPGMSYYPPPDYLGALTTIQLDVEVKNFHLNNTQNSMMPSMSVSFTNGVPSEEERDILMRQLEAKYSSTNNAGRIFLFFSESPETAPIISPIPNNASDAWYSQMAPQIEATILQGWRLTSPQIIGVKTSGQLGGREELLDAYNLFLEIVVKPVQEEVLKALEKVIFLKTGKQVNLGIEQNQLLPTLEQTAVGDVKGI